MSNPRPTEEPSVADLVDRLSEQTARLVRDELKLARAE
ncbi:MAG: phage holin family protein [Brachybacterium tyrofermentans]